MSQSLIFPEFGNIELFKHQTLQTPNLRNIKTGELPLPFWERRTLGITNLVLIVQPLKLNEKQGPVNPGNIG